MELSFTRFNIECIHPFGISRSTHESYSEIFIFLEHHGILGRGEASSSARYGESAKAILSVLEKGITLPEEIVWPDIFEEIVFKQCNGLRSLEAAFSMAYLDWWTQQNGTSVKEYFNIKKSKGPLTSFTIAIGDLELIPQKIEEAAPYEIIKVKLGTEYDKEIINSIRTETDKTIRVDANEGWDVSRAIEMCSWLSERNIQFVEQPLPASDLTGTAEVKNKSPIPIIADENSIMPEDIPKIAYAFDGINIKLMKCGSLLKAKQMIDLAREWNLQIMLGCMVESSVGITAAAHLSPLVDYADLDGHVLIENNPYAGVQIENGRIVIPRGNGLGLKLYSPQPGLK